MNLFENFGLSQTLQLTIKQMGFTEPTQIQRLAIPHIIAGKDLIGESATGSGKTLAFGCGIVEKVTSDAGVQALILAPTRELAEQVKDSLREIAHHNQLRIIAVYGGVSITRQILDMKKADVVVATPGRLLDHIKRRTIDLTKIKILVLDEADRMLDMGFIDDVERIIRACPNNRQTLFFSATISPDITRLAHRYMKEPISVNAKNMVDPNKLKQFFYEVPKHMKLSMLAHLLENEKTKLAMIFCNTRRTTDFVVKNLKSNGIEAIAIHGGLSQDKRTKTIKRFNDANSGALVCTDVAARGLHIEDVSHIYNYEAPNDPKDYVHRIGRTARAGEHGKVINLLCDSDHNNFSRIMREYPSFHVVNVKLPYLKKTIEVKTDAARKPPREKKFFRGPRRKSSGRRF